MKPGRALVLSLVLAGLPRGAGAQDAHYWTQQYGPRAGLLGGAVIGSAEDFSAAFYNPGGLAFVQQGTFAVSAHVLEWQNLTLEDGGGPGVDLDTSRSGLQPSLIAGRLPFGGESHRWTYSVLTRQRVDSDVIANVVREEPQPFIDLTASTLRLENDVRDTWAGLSYAHRASARVGVGVSMFGSWRQQSRREEVVAQLLAADGQGAALVELGGLEYQVARLLWKAGVRWTPWDRLLLGLSVTTPAISLFGSSEMGSSSGRFGVQPSDELSGTIKNVDSAVYKNPLSIGFGGAYGFGSTRIHVSGEWFDAIAEYDVADAPATGLGADTVDLAVVHAARSLVNWGVGLEHRFGGRVKGYASYVVDRSATPAEPAPGQNVGTAPWDTHLVNAGADLDIEGIHMTLGVGIGFGDTPFGELIDLSGPGDGILNDETTLRFRSWRLIFGIEL